MYKLDDLDNDVTERMEAVLVAIQEHGDRTIEELDAIIGTLQGTIRLVRKYRRQKIKEVNSGPDKTKGPLE